MKRITLIFAVLAFSGTGAVIWQRDSLSEFRENENHRIKRENVSGISNAEAGAIEQELRALREQTKELPKLRNEISQLRSMQVELARARAENERLLDARRTGSLIPHEPPPGFISKDRLTFAGYATPEAAIETFFWAMREGNVGAVMESLSPGNEDRLHFEQMDTKAREKLDQKFKDDGQRRTMEHFNDFTIASREETARGVFRFHIRSSVVTNTFPLELGRFGNEWKLRDIGPSGNGRAMPVPQISPPNRPRPVR
jgi:hypothetical protein